MEIGGHDSKIYFQQNLFYCNNCNRRFPSDTLQIHQIYCIRNFIKCDTCAIMVDKASIEEHKKQMHSSKKCQYCNQSIMGRQFDLHFQNCMLKPVVCNYCKKIFPKIQLQKHSTICEAEVKQCNICNKKIAKKQLQVHIVRCKNSQRIRRQNSQQSQIDPRRQLFRQNSQNHINLSAKHKNTSKQIIKKVYEIALQNHIGPQQIKQKISPIPISIQITIREKQSKQATKKQSNGKIQKI